MTLEQTIFAIRPLDEKSMTATRNRFANIAMPLGGLGLLQDAIVQLAGILGQPVPDISRRAAVVFCADNGVVAEGVTQCGQEVTATVAENMGHGESTVCLMAKHLGMDVFPVDIGVARPIKNEKVLQFAVRRGTANFAHEPAMTRKEALEAVEIGIKMAEMCAEKGYSLLIGGEMGIGNTTTSAAVTAALTGAEAAAVTGRGAAVLRAAEQPALDRTDRTHPVYTVVLVKALVLDCNDCVLEGIRNLVAVHPFTVFLALDGFVQRVFIGIRFLCIDE